MAKSKCYFLAYLVFRIFCLQINEKCPPAVRKQQNQVNPNVYSALFILIFLFSGCSSIFATDTVDNFLLQESDFSPSIKWLNVVSLNGEKQPTSENHMMVEAALKNFTGLHPDGVSYITIINHVRKFDSELSWVAQDFQSNFQFLAPKYDSVVVDVDGYDNIRCMIASKGTKSQIIECLAYRVVTDKIVVYTHIIVMGTVEFDFAKQLLEDAIHGIQN